MRLSPLTPEQRNLAEAHWEDARRMASKVGARHAKYNQVEPDDVAFDAIYRAVRAWQPDRPFLPILIRCCQLAWIDQIRYIYGRSGLKYRRPLIMLFCDTPGTGRIGGVFAADLDRIDTALEAAEEVEKMTRGLPRQHARAVREHFLHCRSVGLRKLGQNLGVGDSAACRILGEAYAELRRQLQERAG